MLYDGDSLSKFFASDKYIFYFFLFFVFTKVFLLNKKLTTDNWF